MPNDFGCPGVIGSGACVRKIARYAYYKSKGDRPVATTGWQKLTIILLAVIIMGFAWCDS